MKYKSLHSFLNLIRFFYNEEHSGNHADDIYGSLSNEEKDSLINDISELGTEAQRKQDFECYGLCLDYVDTLEKGLHIDTQDFYTKFSYYAA